MKNKFFVGIELVILCAIVWCAGVGVFIWYAIDAFGEDLWLAIFLTIMLAVLPTIVLVGVVMAFAAKVHIDEDGITKSLFGIRLKFYAWQDIDQIACYGNEMLKSISFYKKRKEKAIFYRLMKYERIYFYLDDKRLSVIEYYAPDYIKDKIQIK